MKKRRLCTIALFACGFAFSEVGCGGGATTPAGSTAPVGPTTTPTPTPTPAPVTLDDLRFDATIASTCSDPSHDPQMAYSGGEVDGRQDIWPRCFPNYFLKYQGSHTAEGRPLPYMGRTCGPFQILVVFEDTAESLARLQQNTNIPTATMQLIKDGKIEEGLKALFDSYTAWQIVGGYVDSRWAGKRIPFSFTFDITRTPDAGDTNPAFARWLRYDSSPGGPNGQSWGASVYELVGVGQRFPNYNAVIFLHPLVGQISGYGVSHWPLTHPIFNQRSSSYVTQIDPRALMPGLLGHELLGHNVPGYLSQYTLGPFTTETRDGRTFEVTPVYNPRTGENIEPLIRAYEGKTTVFSYFSGWSDMDNDGVLDCVDKSIASTADNVDGDLVPDRLDPDLSANNSAYFWRPPN